MDARRAAMLGVSESSTARALTSLGSSASVTLLAPREGKAGVEEAEAEEAGVPQCKADRAETTTPHAARGALQRLRNAPAETCLRACARMQGRTPCPTVGES